MVARRNCTCGRSIPCHSHLRKHHHLRRLVVLLAAAASSPHTHCWRMDHPLGHHIRCRCHHDSSRIIEPRLGKTISASYLPLGHTDTNCSSPGFHKHTRLLPDQPCSHERNDLHYPLYSPPTSLPAPHVHQHLPVSRVYQQTRLRYQFIMERLGGFGCPVHRVLERGSFRGD